MSFSKSGRATAVLFILGLLFYGCKAGSSSDNENETDTTDTTAVSMDGVWYKAWTSTYKFGPNAANNCDAMIAEFSGTSCKLVFYTDTQQTYGLKGTYTRTGTTSGAIVYSFTQEWDSTNRVWVAYSYTQTMSYTVDSAAAFTGVDWAGTKQAYTKLSFSRPSTYLGTWGGPCDFDGTSGSDPAINLSWTPASDGTFVYYMDGDTSLTQSGDSWGVAQVSASGYLLRDHSTTRGSETGKSVEDLLPFTLAGTVMSMNPGKTNAFTLTKAVTLAGTVSTLAGTGTSGSTNSTTGTSALLNRPCGVTVVGSKLYAVENGNHDVRAVDLSTTAVTTLVSSGLAYPSYCVSDGTYLYVSDTNNNQVCRVLLVSPYTVDVVCPVTAPAGIVLIGNNLYVAAESNTIVLIEKGSEVFPWLSCGFVFNVGTSALQGLATDGTFIYAANSGDNTIWRVDVAQVTATLIAGATGTSGSTNATGTAARFYYPYGLAADGNYLYIADCANQTIRRMNLATRAVDTLAGKTGVTGTADLVGTNATFYDPEGLCLSGSTLYVGDFDNHKIRKIQ